MLWKDARYETWKFENEKNIENYVPCRYFSYELNDLKRSLMLCLKWNILGHKLLWNMVLKCNECWGKVFGFWGFFSILAIRIKRNIV